MLRARGRSLAAVRQSRVAPLQMRPPMLVESPELPKREHNTRPAPRGRSAYAATGLASRSIVSISPGATGLLKW